MNTNTVIPQGLKLIVRPLPKKEETMDSGIVAAVMADLSEGEVVFTGHLLNGVISVGDVVLYPTKRGVTQWINKEPLLWLDAEPSREEVWGVIKK